MEFVNKWIAAIWLGVVSLFVEVEAIMIPCLVFIGIDFILGILTDIKACLRKGEKWGVRSGKIWNSIFKLVGVGLAIVLTQLYTNSYIDWIGINLGKIIAGVIAGVELYSILGHLIFLTDWYGFKVVRELFKKEIEDKTGVKISTDE